ncbi:MAG: hypothetical protein AAF673_03610 [Pseudomonadota bacterium]
MTIRVHCWKISDVLWLVVFWSILGGFAMHNALTLLSMVRRIKGLGSVNYMAASFSSSLTFLLLTLLYSKYRKKFADYIKITYSILLSFACAYGVFLSGSRSSIASIILAALVSFIFQIIRSRTRVKPKTIFILTIATNVVIFGISLIYTELSNQYDFTRLLSRFEISSIADASENRLINNWVEAIPSDDVSALIGMPHEYPLFDDFVSQSAIHPHNLLLSIWRFSGLLPTLIFIFLIISIIFFVINKIRCQSVNYKSYLDLLIISTFTLILFVYTLFSGHYTRHWHFYFSLGILCGFLDELVCKKYS